MIVLCMTKILYIHHNKIFYINNSQAEFLKMEARSLPLVATKWLGSVSAMLCTFMFMHLAPWHVVYIFFKKKKFKKMSGVMGKPGRVGLAPKKWADCGLARYLFGPKNSGLG